MKLKGNKIAVLIESDFYEHEIWYYNYRFPEEGAKLHFLSRLWGQPSITFKGQRLDAVQWFRGKRWASVRFALDALSRKPGPVSCPRELLEGV